MATLAFDAVPATGQPSTAPASHAMFTCLSCSIAYPSAADQRTHYRSDLHRYNMKRRVAGLPPVRPDVFNAKVLERRAEAQKEMQAVAASEQRCDICSKSFSSANAFENHLQSKKHKESEAKAKASSPNRPPQSSDKAETAAGDIPPDAKSDDPPLVFRVPAPADKAKPDSALDRMWDMQSSLPETAVEKASVPVSKKAGGALVFEEGATQEEIDSIIEAKIQSARRIDPASACIFCAQRGFHSLDDSLEHMRRTHGFFVPERDYLVDLPGLMTYLSDKVCVGNLCLYCNGRGRAFHTAEAARKHMIDKSHCKVAYDSEEDQLELSDFYDFTSSYPDAAWEDVSDGDGEGDEVEDGEAAEDEDDDVTVGRPSTGARLGGGGMELILPSGAVLGHRSLQRYWNQSLRPYNDDEVAAASMGNSGRAVAHRVNSRYEKALRLEREAGNAGAVIAQRDGQLVKARNRGEAREAKRHIREFRDVKRREDFKTRVAFTRNNQKYFRDPLLQ